MCATRAYQVWVLIDVNLHYAEDDVMLQGLQHLDGQFLALPLLKHERKRAELEK
jgi:hypothetical protein